VLLARKDFTFSVFALVDLWHLQTKPKKPLTTDSARCRVRAIVSNVRCRNLKVSFLQSGRV